MFLSYQAHQALCPAPAAVWAVWGNCPLLQTPEAPPQWGPKKERRPQAWKSRLERIKFQCHASPSCLQWALPNAPLAVNT